MSVSKSKAQFEKLCSYRASSGRLQQLATAPPLPQEVLNFYSNLVQVPVDTRILYVIGDKSFASRDLRTDLVRVERLFAVFRALMRGGVDNRRRFCLEENLGVGDVVYGLPLIKAEPAFQVCCRPDVAWLISDIDQGKCRCMQSLASKHVLAQEGVRVAATLLRRMRHYADLLWGNGDTFTTTEDFFHLMVLQRWGSWETAEVHFADALATRHQEAAGYGDSTPKARVWLDLGGQSRKFGCVRSIAAVAECTRLVAARLNAEEELVVNIRPSREPVSTHRSMSDLLQSLTERNVRVIEELDVRIIAREMSLCRRVICSAATSGLISLFFGYPTSILFHQRSNPKWPSIRAAFESRTGHRCTFHEVNGDGNEESVVEAIGRMPLV